MQQVNIHPIIKAKEPQVTLLHLRLISSFYILLGIGCLFFFDYDCVLRSFGYSCTV